MHITFHGQYTFVKVNTFCLVQQRGNPFLRKEGKWNLEELEN